MITITHTHEDGTILTGSHRGDGVYDIVKQHGFRYSRQVGIYIRGSRDRDAPTARIEAAAAALRACGHQVSIEIDDTWRPAAHREAARSDRAAERADLFDERASAAAGRRDRQHDAAHAILDGIPAGQPMLPGHHSYPADRNRRDRALTHLDQARDEDRTATHYADRADAVRAHNAHLDDPRVIMRRIERIDADLRRARRILDDPATTGAYRERVQRDGDRLAEDLAHQRATLAQFAADGTFVAWGRDNLAKGDLVSVNGHGWYPVTRVNTKTVSLDNDGWPHKAPFDKITGRRRDGLQLDSPTGEPWPVALAVAVARWRRLLHAVGRGGYDEDARRRDRHVRWAQRLVHGLDLSAAVGEVAAFTPPPDAPDAEAEQRRLAAAYLAVYQRLDAGDAVPDIVADLPPDGREPAWRMPDGQPVDRHPDAIHEGDILAGIYDHHGGGLVLISQVVGPVTAVSGIRHRDHRDWITLALHDGSTHELATSRWLAVHCPHPQQP
ncbi:DUF3560 domain-containing protein [Catenuloplanes indicus]|uniref:DUF3560 domain-containing protein n=1 Tax=Catenuloplanes indicus TaxID=137267 RepID=A0AAE3VZV0_9ACTN|nr:DUF3560 domain-containing protein [Catenuloplanes indicus]MDQ0366861.1 hypothetical protein [Catenuloplanes indicus]